MRNSQKGILIGNKGAALKKTGTQARIDMEDFFEKKVFLKLYVKVEPDWRENRRKLRDFGYIYEWYNNWDTVIWQIKETNL